MTETMEAPRWGTARLPTKVDSAPKIVLETVPCPHCDGRDFDAILAGRDALTGIGDLFSLVRCLGCDLILTNPRPAADSFGWFYPQDYSPYQSESSPRPRWEWLEHQALRATYGYLPQPAGVLTSLMARLATWKFHSRFQRHEWFPFRSPGRLLDVGCGAGAYLERMRTFGWNVTGLDYASDVARRVEARTGIHVLDGTLPHPELEPESFDAVTMWHVLEHVPDPRRLVQSAAELLTTGGLLVIEVPNIESRTFAEFGEHWFGLELPRHLQHFTPQTLRAALPESLLRILEIQQIGMRTWIKHSAQRALAAGRTEYNDWLMRGKSFWTDLAQKSETAEQADVIRLVAERRP